MPQRNTRGITEKLSVFALDNSVNSCNSCERRLPRRLKLTAANFDSVSIYASLNVAAIRDVPPAFCVEIIRPLGFFFQNLIENCCLYYDDGV